MQRLFLAALSVIALAMTATPAEALSDRLVKVSQRAIRQLGNQFETVNLWATHTFRDRFEVETADPNPVRQIKFQSSQAQCDI